jgi:hypothetical protein
MLWFRILASQGVSSSWAPTHYSTNLHARDTNFPLQMTWEVQVLKSKVVLAAQTSNFEFGDKQGKLCFNDFTSQNGRGFYVARFEFCRLGAQGNVVY